LKKRRDIFTIFGTQYPFMSQICKAL